MVAAAAATVGCTTVTPAPKGADPVNPVAVAPPVTYRPVFEGYQPYADQAVGNWRDANDTVGRIGGWREYAREVAAPGEAPSGAPPTAGAAGAAPATGGHAGHMQK